MEKFTKPKVLFFDINGTILDVAPLKVLINNNFNQEVFDLWFTKLLHYSLVSTITGTFNTFEQIAINSLKIIAAIKEVSISDNLPAEMLSSLPSYSDVAYSLKALKTKGYMLVALSNSSKDLLSKQLINAGIDDMFDKQISVESFGKYKPHRQVYIGSSLLLNSKRDDCMLVAAHDWDIYGALCAGIKAAYIKRERHSF